MPIAIPAKPVYPALMRYLIAALLAMLLLSACDTGEDRDFFYGGWLHPQRASEQRMNSR